MVEALRLKLSNFGLYIDGPAEVFCDIQLGVKSSSI